jgi:kynurenine formamidase
VKSGELFESLTTRTVVELGHALERNIPVSLNHPGFHLALLRRHGDQVREDGTSGANELMVMGGHTGTHVDALCHVAHEGRLHGGIDAGEAQIGGRFSALGVETIGPIVVRGVLLDVAGAHGVECLDGGAPVGPRDLEAAAARVPGGVREGDAVLVRTGWAKHWRDHARFRGEVDGAPGVDLDGADWLLQHEPRIAGTDTMAFEQILPDLGHARLPVHRALLVEAGLNLLEMLALDELAALGVYEFLFVLSPLKVVGATGVPVNPLAILV